MSDTPDAELLEQFARNQSEAAFAELVQRHIGLVYSIAFRKTGNPQQAEDITQAVFIILARKAGSLSPKTVLSGWLHHTARLTAANLQRAELRRLRREQEAFMQSTLTTNESAPVALWHELSPLLDDAVASLGAGERDAIVLRFFENKNFTEVGATLGASEEAARMRVNRALEKLQKHFSRRGIHSTTAAIAGSISVNSSQAMPAGLAQTISAVALAKSAVASASALTLAKGTLKFMAWTKAKITIAVGVATVVIGGGTYLVYHSETAPAATGSSTFVDSSPVQIDNSDFRPDGDQNGTFIVEVDPDTLRTTNSAPAIHIGGPVGSDSSSILQSPFTANGTYKKTDNSSSTKYYVTHSSVLYGKHIRVTGWLKTRNVRGWASAFLMIVGMDGRLFQYDNMSDRPIRGTTDWQQVEMVTDLPDEACIVYFGPDPYGPGELWGDDFQISLAPPGTPSTDDRHWRVNWGSDPVIYSETTDFDVTHNGHPAICLTYTPDGPAPRGTHISWRRDFYGSDSDKYCGHTVRLNGWLKTENVSGRIEPVILPYAGYFKLLAKHHNDYTPKGTSDWTQFSVTCPVPEDTEYLQTGFDFYGSGKVWIDTNSLTFEIVRSW